MHFTLLQDQKIILGLSTDSVFAKFLEMLSIVVYCNHCRPTVKSTTENLIYGLDCTLYSISTSLLWIILQPSDQT